MRVRSSRGASAYNFGRGRLATVVMVLLFFACATFMNQGVRDLAILYFSTAAL